MSQNVQWQTFDDVVRREMQRNKVIEVEKRGGGKKKKLGNYVYRRIDM